jgi:hypothetical protein
MMYRAWMMPFRHVSVHNIKCSGKRTHRNVTENSQQDVDEEISIAAALEEDAQRWENDGEQDLANVAVGLLAAILR